MSTVVSRVVRSSPHRNTSDTWIVIVDLLTQGKDGEAREELLSVSGVASTVIAEQAAKEAAIVVTCDGPRTRIYCLYDEGAIEGSDAKEDAIGFDALKGQWAVSLPCPKDDLEWVQRALNAKSTRVTARDLAQPLGDESVVKATSRAGLTLNADQFLKS